MSTSAIVYVPGKMVGAFCKPATSNCPVVLILHADGEGPPANAHLNYSALGKHLASRGFVVISVNRSIDHNDVGRQGSIVGSLYRFLNNGGLGIKAITNNTTAIVGHSAGGKAAQRTSVVPSMEGWSLKCLCLMAPTMDGTKRTYTGIITAFMNITVVGDTDPGSMGFSDQGKPMVTGLTAFEDAAIISSNAFAFEKHFVRVAGYLGHYFQNEPFTLMYMAAFLHRYQKEEIGYQQFLKGQALPASLKNLGTSASHLHEDAVRKLIVDMDTSEPVFEASATGVSEVKFGDAFSFDSRSLHSKRVLKFKWNRSQPGPNFIKLNLLGSIDASAWKMLSFNIAQIYFDNRITGPSVGIEVTLFSMNQHMQSGHSTLSIVDFGGPITYPQKMALSDLDITRNSLGAINIPIAKFISKGNGAFSIGKLIAITFNLSSNPVGSGQNAILMINEIKLLH